MKTARPNITRRPARAGFSLIELVIVVVIIGVIAAIAIPKMSRGAQGAADSALAADMAMWRQAMDMYAAEHNGNYPDLDNIIPQLTQFSDAAGQNFSGQQQQSQGIIYGPYLRAIPSLPVGHPTEKGQTAIGQAAPGIAWIYNGTGTIIPNTSNMTDANGKTYASY
jgi:prepilin-type N-terminal cleavage/methylation domain-containing protein